MSMSKRCPQHGLYRVYSEDDLCPVCMKDTGWVYFVSVYNKKNELVGYKLGSCKNLDKRFSPKDRHLIEWLYVERLPNYAIALKIELDLLERYKHLKIENLNLLDYGNTEILKEDPFGDLDSFKNIVFNILLKYSKSYLLL